MAKRGLGKGLGAFFWRRGCKYERNFWRKSKQK